MTSLAAIHAQERKTIFQTVEPPYDDETFLMILKSSRRMVDRVMRDLPDDFKAGDFGFQPEIHKPLKAIDIIEAVSEETKVEVAEILSDRQSKRVCRARFMAAYLIHRGTGRSTPRIGLDLRRDHTSIMNALTRCREIMKEDQDYFCSVMRVMDRLSL